MSERPSANVFGPGTMSERLGILAQGADTWFSVRPGEAIEAIVGNVLNAIQERGISWLRVQERPDSPRP